MRLGIKGKQVFGVTAIVGVTVVVLSLMHLARLAQVSLDESRARAELLANAIFHRARAVVGEGGDPFAGLRRDPGLRSLLESSLYSDNVTFASIVDARGVAVVHVDPAMEGLVLAPPSDMRELTTRSALGQLRAIYRGQGRDVDFTQPLLLAGTEFGSIRVGVSTLLIRRDLRDALLPEAITALVVLGLAVAGATTLAQLLLRPIHVIRSGLTRLGRGEVGVRLDLQQEDEFGELGTFFNAMSDQLAADRSHMVGQVANLESAVEHFQDAVAIVSPRGQILFANPAMRALCEDDSLDTLLSERLPLRRLFEETVATRQSRGPTPVTFSTLPGESGERLLLTHPVDDVRGTLVGILIIVRNLEYLGQVESTVRYSRKLAALGRLSAGVAHEVKNPLNAMAIHLELLRQHVSARPLAGVRGSLLGGASGGNVEEFREHVPDALEHIDVIAGEIRRLDEVVQGFLKFSRPEDLKLQPVVLLVLLDEVVPIVRPEADRHGVEVIVECDGSLAVNGDPGMLRQAFLNLALNACQAMPNGGTLRIRCEPARGRRVSILIADTGMGIQPEHLARIFDLYFTTKPKGTGIGLSMVYRIVQMHDGEIEVESTPGEGTSFRMLLPQAT